MEYNLHQKNRNEQHNYYERTKQPDEFQYRSTHQELLHKPYPLFWVNYLYNKHC